MTTTGKRIQQVRAEIGITKEDLAVRLGVNRTTVVAWESDKNQPRGKNLHALSRELGVPSSWLASGDGDRGGMVDIGIMVDEDLDKYRNKVDENFKTIYLEKTKDMLGRIIDLSGPFDELTSLVESNKANIKIKDRLLAIHLEMQEIRKEEVAPGITFDVFADLHISLKNAINESGKTFSKTVFNIMFKCLLSELIENKGKIVDTEKIKRFVSLMEAENTNDSQE